MRERRVLGVLVEKQKTSKTADTYPLTVNALVSGCNQKSNRDPVLNLGDDEVEDTLLRCQKRGLVARVTGSRVERWKHLLYEAWHVDKLDLAILAELLLRGPQTEGELRTRVSRMESIDDLDALRGALKPLVERTLVVYLTPEDRRGAVVTHGFHDPRELERLRERAAAQPVGAAETGGGGAGVDLSAELARIEERLPGLESGLATANKEIAALMLTVGEMRNTIAALQEELRGLKQALGV
jgi:uncharacterized protein YceH (UPF0502 family)